MDAEPRSAGDRYLRVPPRSSRRASNGSLPDASRDRARRRAVPAPAALERDAPPKRAARPTLEPGRRLARARSQKARRRLRIARHVDKIRPARWGPHASLFARRGRAAREARERARPLRHRTEVLAARAASPRLPAPLRAFVSGRPNA